MHRYLLICLVFTFFAGLTPSLVHAEEREPRNVPVRLFLDATTQTRGFTLFSQDHLLTFGVPAYSLPLRERIRVTLKRKSTLPKEIKKNSNQQLYSFVYSFDVYNQETVWPEKPLWLKIHYIKEGVDVPLTLGYWDSNLKEWVALSSKQDKLAQTVSAGITLPYAYIALMAAPEPEVYESGTASWYDYPYAAHRTLPFGTKLLVTNTNNGKSVMVEVHDRGPFIEGRIIDLPMTAFEQIASLGAGVIPVTIQIVTP